MAIVELIVIALRIAASALAISNLTWTVFGARALMRGQVKPPEIYLAVVFWMAVTVLVFQASYIVGPTPFWRLFAYALLSLTMGLAFMGNRLGATIKARQFYSTYEHLAVALAMVDLAKVDPGAAERMADQCRRLTVSKVLAND